VTTCKELETLPVSSWVMAIGAGIIPVILRYVLDHAAKPRCAAVACSACDPVIG
jgi:hypothetical protein